MLRILLNYEIVQSGMNDVAYIPVGESGDDYGGCREDVRRR